MLGISLRALLIAACRPAFLGIPDSGTYIHAARSNLFLDPVHPAGYAVFLRVLHLLAPRLVLVAAAQHALGVLTALMVFELVRRTASTAVAIVPAVVVLFNGLQLWTEHTPLSDPLFTALVAAALLLAVSARAEPAAWKLGALGVALGAATTVRTVGLLLVPLLCLWLLVCGSGTVGRRWPAALAPLVVAVAIAGGYVALQDGRSGVLGFTASDGRITYAVAAPFADCAKFTPPAGTRGLCETSRPRRRGSFNQYLWGFPDHAVRLGAGGRAAVSPAWRLFGAMPGGNGRLAAFGRAAILHQPLDYAKQVLRDFSYFWRSGPTVFIRDAAATDPDVAANARAYYSDGGRTTRWAWGFFAWYARHLEPSGLLILLLLAASLLPLAAPRSELRRVGLLCAATGWLLLAGAALVAVDNRYALPALGPLAAAAAIGAAAARARRRDGRPDGATWPDGARLPPGSGGRRRRPSSGEGGGRTPAGPAGAA